MKIGYLFFSALGPQPHMLALSLSAPGFMKFISAGFDFLLVCVIKCSCETLIKHMWTSSLFIIVFYEKFLRINCMNKCTVPKKKNIVLSNNQFSQETVIVYKKADELYIEWQWVTRTTTSDNNWQWVAGNDSGTTHENDTIHFKEWVTAILSVTKTGAPFPGMAGSN